MVGFTQIGLTAALILNRLRNEQRMKEHSRADEEGRGEHDNAEQDDRAKLERMSHRCKRSGSQGGAAS